MCDCQSLNPLPWQAKSFEAKDGSFGQDGPGAHVMRPGHGHSVSDASSTSDPAETLKLELVFWKLHRMLPLQMSSNSEWAEAQKVVKPGIAQAEASWSQCGLLLTGPVLMVVTGCLVALPLAMVDCGI